MTTKTKPPVLPTGGQGKGNGNEQSIVALDCIISPVLSQSKRALQRHLVPLMDKAEARMSSDPAQFGAHSAVWLALWQQGRPWLGEAER